MRMFNRWHVNLSGGSRNRSHWGKLKNWNQTNPEITVSFSQMPRRQHLAISCPSSWLRDMQVTDPGQADGETDSHPETLWCFVYFPKYKCPRGQRPRALLTQEQGGHRGLFLGSNQTWSGPADRGSLKSTGARQESHSRVHYEVQVKGTLAGFQLLPGASVMSGAQVEASRVWGVVQGSPSAKRQRLQPEHQEEHGAQHPRPSAPHFLWYPPWSHWPWPSGHLRPWHLLPPLVPRDPTPPPFHRGVLGCRPPWYLPECRRGKRLALGDGPTLCTILLCPKEAGFAVVSLMRDRMVGMVTLWPVGLLRVLPTDIPVGKHGWGVRKSFHLFFIPNILGHNSFKKSAFSSTKRRQLRWFT